MAFRCNSPLKTKCGVTTNGYVPGVGKFDQNNTGMEIGLIQFLGDFLGDIYVLIYWYIKHN